MSKAVVLDGKAVAARVRAEVKARASRLPGAAPVAVRVWR